MQLEVSALGDRQRTRDMIGGEKHAPGVSTKDGSDVTGVKCSLMQSDEEDTEDGCRCNDSERRWTLVSIGEINELRQLASRLRGRCDRMLPIL